MDKRLSLADLPLPPAGKIGWPWTEESAIPADAGTPHDRPCISVITPSFNQAEFLEETIRSVLLQRYPNLEYIIIDGGSEDGSLAIIQKYEPWIDHWVSEKDRGQSHAINKGFERATGELICWLNSDDIFCEGALYAVAGAFERRPAWLISQPARLDAGGIVPFPRVAGVSFRELLIDAVRLNQPGVIFSKGALTDCGKLREDLHHAMDYEFWLRMITRCGEPAVIEQVVGLDRMQPGSKTARKWYWYEIEMSELSMKYAVQSGYDDVNSLKRYWNRRTSGCWSAVALEYALGGRRGAAIRCLGRALRGNFRVLHRRSFRSALLNLVVRSG